MSPPQQANTCLNTAPFSVSVNECMGSGAFGRPSWGQYDGGSLAPLDGFSSCSFGRLHFLPALSLFRLDT